MKDRAYITHKNNEDYSDCQDRFHIDKKKKRVAVSDGISQSIFSQYWADLLSKRYVDKGKCDESDRVEMCYKWLKLVQTELKRQQKKGISTWLLENNLTRHNGAGATICGVEFKDSKKWRASILGDSCVVIVKERKKVKLFSSEEKTFDSLPDYYDSYQENKGKGQIKNFDGQIDEKTTMYLVTDPFSELFQRLENEEKKIEEISEKIRKLKTHDDFCQFVDECRREYNMRDDDSTLCVVEYDGQDNMTIINDDSDCITGRTAKKVSKQSKNRRCSRDIVLDKIKAFFQMPLFYEKIM